MARFTPLWPKFSQPWYNMKNIVKVLCAIESLNSISLMWLSAMCLLLFEHIFGA